MQRVRIDLFSDEEIQNRTCYRFSTRVSHHLPTDSFSGQAYHENQEALASNFAPKTRLP